MVVVRDNKVYTSGKSLRDAVKVNQKDSLRSDSFTEPILFIKKEFTPDGIATSDLVNYLNKQKKLKGIHSCVRM